MTEVQIPEKAAMFSQYLPFAEIFRDPEYFFKNKGGLKAEIIMMRPEEYIQVVESRQSDHKKYGPDRGKLDALFDAQKKGIRIEMPIVAFGGRDEPSGDFLQEGYHRACVASYLGIKMIPVGVRYRESDSNIPPYIRNRLGGENCLNIINVITHSPAATEHSEKKVVANQEQYPCFTRAL